jgi:hypothetical protein
MKPGDCRDAHGSTGFFMDEIEDDWPAWTMGKDALET